MSSLFEANHWYTKNSIALMLVPAHVEPNKGMTMADWAYEYASQTCEKDIKISLYKNGQFQVILDNKKTLSEGAWKITEFPYIELHSSKNDWYLYFELKSYMENDQIGEIQIYQLAPMANYFQLKDCRLINGIRN